MGRHSTGKNNLSLSEGLIALIAAVALVLVAGAAWFLRGSGADGGSDSASGDTPQCVSGDLQLPVAAANENVGQELIHAYANSHPVVRDYCVKPEYTDALQDAAVYIAPVSPISEGELSRAGRSATMNEPPVVYSTPVGLADAATEATGERPSLDRVLFPTSQQPEASAIAARALADSDEAAVGALTAQRIRTAAEAASQQDGVIATAEDSVPDGFAFTELDDATLAYSAIPLNTTDKVGEEQSRAAQAFAEYTGKMFTDAHGESAPQDGLSESLWAAAAPENGARITDAGGQNDENAGSNRPAQGGPDDTLFLLDTSATMAEYNDSAAEAIGAAASDLTGDGHSVALWNYSSPLTPGVNKGYRANVPFTDNANELAGTAQRFINDGRPLTREAVSAAVEYAASESTTEKPVRILLITSGTADGGDESAKQALEAANDSGVSLAVVHVGGAERDHVLADAAEFTDHASAADGLTPAVRAAAGLE